MAWSLPLSGISTENMNLRMDQLIPERITGLLYDL